MEQDQVACFMRIPSEEAVYKVVLSSDGSSPTSNAGAPFPARNCRTCGAIQRSF